MIGYSIKLIINVSFLVCFDKLRPHAAECGSFQYFARKLIQDDMVISHGSYCIEDVIQTNQQQKQYPIKCHPRPLAPYSIC